MRYVDSNEFTPLSLAWQSVVECYAGMPGCAGLRVTINFDLTPWFAYAALRWCRARLKRNIQ
jgi:hypothetical protein